MNIPCSLRFGVVQCGTSAQSSLWDMPLLACLFLLRPNDIPLSTENILTPTVVHLASGSTAESLKELTGLV